jgi:hypothetical protein
MKQSQFDIFTARMGNPEWGPWGEERIAISASNTISYECRRGQFVARATAALTPAGIAQLVQALREWPFAEPEPLVGLVPDSTFVDLTVTRDGVAMRRTVVYHAARRLPGYGAPRAPRSLVRHVEAARQPADRRLGRSRRHRRCR